MTAIEEVLGRQLARLKKAIKKHGPLDWGQARLAMTGGSRGDRWDSMRIANWLASGELKEIELPDGDSLIAC